MFRLEMSTVSNFEIYYSFEKDQNNFGMVKYSDWQSLEQE